VSTDTATLRLFREMPTPAGPGNWLARVVQWLNNAALSPAEVELRNTIGSSAALLGAPIIAATSVDDVTDRIDAAIENPELGRFTARAMELMTLEMLVEVSKKASPTPSVLVAVLGQGPAAKIAGVSRVELAVVSAVVQLHVLLGEESLRSADPFEEILRDFLSDSDIPSAVQLATLSGLRSSVAGLAIAHAAFVNRSLEPWLGQRLAEVYTEGLYEYLRLLASVPPISVPDDLVPLDQRIDLAALQDAHAAALKDLDDLAEAATAAGGELVAVPDDP
jgi:hypothetical protein